MENYGKLSIAPWRTITPIGLELSPNLFGLAPGIWKLVVRIPKIVDVERLERRFAEIMADLRLVDADGCPDRRHRPSVGGGTGDDDSCRTGLAVCHRSHGHVGRGGLEWIREARQVRRHLRVDREPVHMLPQLVLVSGEGSVMPVPQARGQRSGLNLRAPCRDSVLSTSAPGGPKSRVGK